MNPYSKFGGDEPTAEWRRRAACKGLDPALFFPERGESPAEAKAACATCPVSGHCLDYAVTHSREFGIYGGATEKERRGLRSAYLRRFAA